MQILEPRSTYSIIIFHKSFLKIYNVIKIIFIKNEKN
jgi:hypothetical protein